MEYRTRKPAFVTAGEVSRNFGRWQDKALERPVIVTHHGRPRVAILASEHSDLEASVPVNGPADTAVARLGALTNAIGEAFMALDADLVITAVNPVLEAYVGQSAFQLVGRHWAEVFPTLRDGVLHEHYRRVLRTGEAAEFEVASLLFPGRVVSQKVFPYGGGVAALFTNRTRERERDRQVEDAAALERLAAAASGLCLIEVNMRGRIARVDDNFIALSGFDADALSRFRLADIVRPRDRSRLLACMDGALEDNEAPSLRASLLARDGREEAVIMTMAPILRDGHAGALRVAVLRAPTGVD